MLLWNTNTLLNELEYYWNMPRSMDKIKLEQMYKNE